MIGVADDQQRGVFQRERVLLQLTKGGIEIFALAFIFPTEISTLPDIGPSVAAACLGRAAFKTVEVAGRIGRGRRRFAQDTAEVEEMFLRRGTLLEFGGAPFADEFIYRRGPRQPSVSLHSHRLGPVVSAAKGSPPRSPPATVYSALEYLRKL